ncbi:MAG: hemin receptor [Hyphomicrobiales bacterium]|nr:MAG: hemin receptor [Hyphomicrobiales bacterium]
MNVEQISLIQDSFVKVESIADRVAQLFYQRLFEIAPETRPLFKREVDDQGRLLMAALALIIRSLADSNTMLPAAQKLAIRHVAYGVKAEHYEPVGDALLWTLENSLGADFTPPLKIAWTKAYAALSAAMVAAAYPQ